MSDVEKQRIPDRVPDIVKGAIESSLAEINAELKDSGGTREKNNNMANSATVPISTGVQNLLIKLLLTLAKNLGLQENELHKVFDEVIKMMNNYKNKKGEV